MDSFLQPVMDAFCLQLQAFRSQMLPMTSAAADWQARDFYDAVGIAPGRMIDTATEMVNQWLKAEAGDDEDSPSMKLPAVIVAMSSDFTPSAVDFSAGISRPEFVTLSDDDPRVFKLQTAVTDERLQVAIAAHDVTTAKSILSQLAVFLRARSHIAAVYEYAGHSQVWPAVIEMSDSPASIVSEAKNLSIFAYDITLKCTIPFYRAPGEGEENDGSDVSPAGYPVVAEFQTKSEVIE